MDIDIDKISTYEPRNKVNIIKWRPIYEVIDEAYFIYYKTFSVAFMQQCKDNANGAQFIPLEVKNKIKRMAMEQGLYEQVIMLRCYLKFVAAAKNQNGAKFKFQGQSAISQRWFDLDFDFIKVIFSTREPDFYKKFFKDMTIHKIQIHLKSFKFQ